jgi:hypothetical protein
MNYVLPSEIALFAQSSRDESLLADVAGQTGLIMQASAIVDGQCNGSLEIIPYFDEEIALDQNLAGRLLRTPHCGWAEDNGTIFYFGNEAGGASLPLSNFSINRQAGIVCDLRARAGHLSVGGFVSSHGQDGHYTQSPYLSTVQQYHLGNLNLVNDNSKPYVLRASYYSGWFIEQPISEDAAIGGNQVVLTDVSFLERGREFYFSSDVPDNAPMIDRRITAIDVDTKTVTFTPALRYALTAANNTLRMIDKQVRSACADIVSDILTYPSNTKDFTELLGKRDLENRWIRINGDSWISASAAAKLANYARK